MTRVERLRHIREARDRVSPGTYDPHTRDIAWLLADITSLEIALKLVLVDDINGYNFDKLMEQTKNFLKTYGGWQNGYAISAVMQARQAAREALDGAK